MSKEDTKRHFAEICETIWSKIEHQERLEKAKHLYELEERLPAGFRRINKSNIANMKHLLRFIFI